MIYRNKTANAFCYLDFGKTHLKFHPNGSIFYYEYYLSIFVPKKFLTEY